MFRGLMVSNRRKTSAWILSLKVLPVANNGKCGLEFDYANQESFYCRPLRLPETDGGVLKRMPVPEEAANLDVAFLPPMSGLASNETRLDTGAINVRVGEGRTAEVLRNLCFQILEERADNEKWGNNLPADQRPIWCSVS